MKSMNWRTVAELIGVMAIVISLVFVGLQLRQDRDLAQVSSFGSMTESANALSDLVHNDSEVWVRGLKGEELTDAETAIFMSLVRAVEARYMNWIVRWQSTGEERFNPNIHARNFAFYAYMYPGLRKAIEGRAEIFQKRDATTAERFPEPPLYEMAMPYLKQFDETNPELPEARTFIVW